ncbi:hypothetical protein X735_27630 [Mesorhizobium sp. L2C085B000]|nr:hypothetical protein X735_27630 [Mesorhizobium sp. L2C085B000]
MSQAVQHVERWIFSLSLDAAQIGSIDLGISRQALLRQLPGNAHLAQVPSQKLTSLHKNKGAS